MLMVITVLLQYQVNINIYIYHDFFGFFLVRGKPEDYWMQLSIKLLPFVLFFSQSSIPPNH